MKKRDIALIVIWTLMTMSMAIIDAFAPNSDFRVSAWLILLFLGMVATIWIFVFYPIQHKNAKKMSIIFTLYLTGVFLLVYNIIWELSEASKGQWGFLTGVSPVALFPFPIIVNPLEWYTLIFIGFIACSISIYFLLTEKEF